MYDHNELERLLLEVKASNVDPRWKRWLEQLVEEIRSLEAELDDLMELERVAPGALGDTSLL